MAWPGEVARSDPRRWAIIAGQSCRLPSLALFGTALVEDVELEAARRREEFVHLAQALGQGGWSQKRIVALAQLVVVHVEVEREQVDGDSVGKGGFEILLARLFRVGRVGGDDLAQLVGVERGFALHLV